MSQLLSDVKNIQPPYSINPVRPAQRDRKSGTRKKKPALPEAPKEDRGPDDPNRPSVDEYI